MYTPEQKNASQIIEDKSIYLPRFQRKKSWKDTTRFEFCISIFKGYPIGTIVLKNEVVNKKTVKWLLDGRQRRDTLIDMQNPDNIYMWAKTYLGFKNKDDNLSIERIFNEKLNEYLYYDKNEAIDDNNEVSTGIECVDDSDSVDDDPIITECIEEELEPKDKNDLSDLLFVIQSVHKKVQKNSNYTRPFDFNVDNFRPTYMAKDEKGKNYVDSKKLTDWILAGNYPDVDTLTIEEFIGNYGYCPNEVVDIIRNRFEMIKKSIDCVKRIHEMLINAKLSVIQLDNSCSPSDSQKIFEIINNQGVRLTNAEILSARPVWNEMIQEPRDHILKDVVDLYNGIGVSRQDGVVKWDVAATFTNRLPVDSDYIFGDLRKISFSTCNNSSTIDNKINYGFKLYSGRFIGSIGKNDIDDLAKMNIDWNSSMFEDEIYAVTHLLLNQDAAIKRFSSYNRPLKNLLGDTVVMCYLFSLITEYNILSENMKKDVLRGNAKKTFIVHSRTLLDRLIYEYCIGLWKGSSDSRLRQNLKKDSSTMFREEEVDQWNALIDEAFEENTIKNNEIDNKVLNVLVYYFTMLRDKRIGLNPGESTNVDHIIPDKTFTDSSSNKKFQNSLYNFALLPESLNEKKQTDVTTLEPSFVAEICNLEDVDEKIIKSLKDPGSIPSLIEQRKKIISEIKERRVQFVRGEQHWEVNIK